MANAVKHARARRVDVAVTRADGRLHVEVVDDGVGPGAGRSGGIGWDSMHQRCHELGGECRIAPAEPGTRVAATLPLHD